MTQCITLEGMTGANESNRQGHRQTQTDKPTAIKRNLADLPKSQTFTKTTRFLVDLMSKTIWNVKH